MKKKKQQTNKTKEFVAKPFTSLKGFKAVADDLGKKEEVPEKRPKPLPDPEGNLLFMQAMADVRRMRSVPEAAKAKKIDSKAIKQSDEQESRDFLNAIEKLHLDKKFHEDIGREHSPQHPVASNRMRDLKRGSIRISLELDLHGLTRDEALQSLERFITGAYNRGQRAVLVITGKGNNSPDEPVLQGAVSGWLRDRGKKMVAEFSPATRQLGGSGAFVVFLKEKDTKENHPS